MDTTKLLDSLLGAGRDLAERGGDLARQAQDYAADRIGVGDTDADRDSFGKGAVGGALAAGALALLLGTRGGRRLGGAAVKMGALAGLGALAYNAYKRYTGEGDATPDGTPIDQLSGEAADSRARALVAAMISAAKCDGHIDEAEREVILTRIRGLEGVDRSFVEDALAAPSDAKAIAALSDNGQSAREIYSVSVLMTNGGAPAERAYLDALAEALGLSGDIARAIEDEAHAA